MSQGSETTRRRVLLLLVEGKSTSAALLAHAIPAAPCEWPVTDLLGFVVSTAQFTPSRHAGPDLGEPSEYRFFDWQGVAIDPASLVVEIPKPGVLVAVRGTTSVVEGALKVGVFGRAFSHEGKLFVQEYLCSPDAQFEPMRACSCDVYIRCSEADQARGDHLRDLLDRQGLRTALVAADRGAPGTEPGAREGGLASARVGIVILGPDSVRQPWVSQLAGAAWALGVPLVPVLVGEVDLPLPDYLSQLQSRTVLRQADWLNIAREVHSLARSYGPPE